VRRAPGVQLAGIRRSLWLCRLATGRVAPSKSSPAPSSWSRRRSREGLKEYLRSGRQACSPRGVHACSIRPVSADPDALIGRGVKPENGAPEKATARSTPAPLGSGNSTPPASRRFSVTEFTAGFVTGRRCGRRGRKHGLRGGNCACAGGACRCHAPIVQRGRPPGWSPPRSGRSPHGRKNPPQNSASR